MASYCCFWRPRQHSNMSRITVPWITGMGRVQLMSFQDMLSLLHRDDVQVAVIQGIGGSGKTWAAKVVYKAAMTSTKFYDCIWVSLSMNCSMERCINKIAASLSCTIRGNLSLEEKKAAIKEYLMTRRFLLVLDNAYFTEENILEYLSIPRPQQDYFCSKIFVTTRTKRTESVVEPDIVITPQPLTYKESHDLLSEKIGKDISLGHDLISNCYGVPLIIIQLAGVLRDAPTQEAFSELVRKVHGALGTKISVYNTMCRIVKFGYHELPSDNAQNCLLYILLFQTIPVKELILFWIMEGLLGEVTTFDEANHIGKEIIDVLIKHGMIYLEDDCVQMNDVIRESLSSVKFDNGCKDLHNWHYSNPINLEHLAKFSNRISLMYTEVEHLHGSPRCFFLSSLLLRGNYQLETISEEFFSNMGTLGILDLSFTRIKALPPSISSLTRLRMLLLIGCHLLEEIRFIHTLVQLEVLDASGCDSLKTIDNGTFDHMMSLKILDLSAIPFKFLISVSPCIELRHLNLLSECPYGVSKNGIVQNLQLGSTEDLVDWMSMRWLPCGLTFRLSGRTGMTVSFNINRDSKTYIYASDAYSFKCLEKDSPLWLNCFEKFQIIISPSMDTDAKETETCIISQHSNFRTKHFAHSIDPKRYLEINGTTSIPSDLDGILYHAELISLKRITMETQFSDLNIRGMKSVRELRVENCEGLESLVSVDEVQTPSAMGNLHKPWFCKGVQDATSFSCLEHLFLDCCPNLIYLFPSALCLPNLETLHIRFSDILQRVFDCSVLGEDTLPRLHSLQLWELPELTCVCDGVLPSLKNLKVKGCAKLRKIPVGVNENSPFVTTIGGEQLWWDGLLWDDETIKRWLLFRNWGPLLPHLGTEG
ncbi:hypothetical protein HU200_012228 [Digitaria exilis]|uniref:NB-ARC domain-containing protein n=1 Tax=Digitaria exilis TaxID=1010633 RepID=A0A835KNH1_9POAL|nr:hypothetical protein HU200_012228 [Digitaria exilis]